MNEFIVRTTDKSKIAEIGNVLYESTLFDDLVIVETKLPIRAILLIDGVTDANVCRNDGKLCV